MNTGTVPNPVLNCAVTLEQFDKSNSVLKKVVYKEATVMLGRNEFRDILFKISGLNVVNKTLFVKNIAVHKRFVNEGKASVQFLDDSVTVFLSNCPSNKLQMFMKVLRTKTTMPERNMNIRNRLRSDKPRTFNEISPIGMSDSLKTKQDVHTKKPLKSLTNTPGNVKRKRDNGHSAEKISPAPKRVPSSLTLEQKRVISAVASGRNVFFTGSAGTGKSFLLNKILRVLPPESTVITASTGIAACHIGGTTLHSFAGIGSGSAPINQCLELASRKSVTQQWRRCQHLIIDEISMVDGNFFHKLECVARHVRKSKLSFGGIQVIVCGDFLQLPPVNKDKENSRFCFQTDAWENCCFVTVELTEVHRQSDPKFINILQNLRLGRCTAEMAAVLKETANRAIESGGIAATRLCTHKGDVEVINREQLIKLPGALRTFPAVDSNPTLSKFVDHQLPVPTQVELKVGAQVMLCKNVNLQQGLVNGARGIVTGFESGLQGLPVVKFLSGKEEPVKFEHWVVKAQGGIQLSRRQIPLVLAWAISIHKSQGMTLDCVELSLARVFENGQAYVALSRARSLNGLRIVDFDENCVHANSDVLRFYKSITGRKVLGEASTANSNDQNSQIVRRRLIS